jgi:hypothetical protein
MYFTRSYYLVSLGDEGLSLSHDRMPRSTTNNNSNNVCQLDLEHSGPSH